MICKNALSCVTSWRVGGVPDLFCAPQNEQELSTALSQLLEYQPKIYFLGSGSNVLVADQLEGVCVIHSAYLNHFCATDLGEEVLLECGAGMLLRDLFIYAVKHSLSGLEFAVGIPGTIGGAIAGNIGAQGNSVGDFVDTVGCFSTLSGAVSDLAANRISWGYRCSSLASSTDLMVTSVTFRLKKGKKSEILKKVVACSQKKSIQPLSAKTAGCVFKNPEKQSAGALLEEAGCKGLRVGEAIVSLKHANFVENTGSATADDIYRLTQKMQKRVFETFGILLEYEVKFIGEFPKSSA